MVRWKVCGVSIPKLGKGDKFAMNNCCQCRVLRSYLILFFWQNPILSYFWGKCPILSFFLAILPLILVFYSPFYHHYFNQEHSLKFFSLASLGIKILFLYIMLESIFKNPFHGWMRCYVCKCRRK